MSVSMALLALLDSHPKHGFALKAQYDALLGQERELKYGQVYSTLARLERDGLARGIGIESGQGADRKVYAITEEGISQLEHWLSTPSVVENRPSEIFTKTLLALASGRSGEQVLATQRRAHLERMRVLTSKRSEGDVITRLAADWEISHLNADMQWIELAAARLTQATGAAQEISGRES